MSLFLSRLMVTRGGQGPAAVPTEPFWHPAEGEQSDSSLFLAVFYLPDMVDDVPGHAAYGVAGVPAAGNERLSRGGLAQCGCDLFAHGCQEVLIVHCERFVSHSDLAGVHALGFDDMLADFVTIATSTAWAFAQFGWRSRDDLFQDVPCCAQ